MGRSLVSVLTLGLLAFLPAGPAAHAEQAESSSVESARDREATRLVEAMRGESMQVRGHSKAPPDRVRERIRRCLRPLRDEAVLALTRALGDDDASMRLNAARMLWQLGSPHGIDDLDPIDITAARGALVTALRDDNRDVRAAAANALGAMQRDAVPALPALIDALQDEWEGARGEACHALRSIGRHAASAAQALETLSRDPVVHVRQCAAVALAAVTAGPAAEPTCSHLPVRASADVLPPVPRGPAPDWYRSLPQTVWEPRHLVLPVAYRVDAQGTVTSACIDGEADTVVAASVRKALLSRRFEPALAAGGPAAVLVRHELELERRDRDPVPPARLDDIEWLEAVVDGLQADVGTQRRLPVPERDSPALRRAAFARLGEIGSADSLRAIERLQHRHAPATAAAIGGAPLRAALFAHFTLADRKDALSIELGHDAVPIDGYRGAVRYGVDRQAAQDAGTDGGPYVSWRTSRSDADAAIVTIRELQVLRPTPGASGESGTTDLVFLRQTAGRWVVVGHRRTWIN